MTIDIKITETGCTKEGLDEFFDTMVAAIKKLNATKEVKDNGSRIISDKT